MAGSRAKLSVPSLWRGERQRRARLHHPPRQRIKSIEALKGQIQWHEPARTEKSSDFAAMLVVPLLKFAGNALFGKTEHVDADQ